MEKSGKHLEIITVSDPICTWCWGSEPILRKLKLRYGEGIRFTSYMGGLVPDIRYFAEDFGLIDPNFDDYNRILYSHWKEAATVHRMPLHPESWTIFDEDFASGYPANIAYRAVSMVAPRLGDRFIRRVRSANFVEGRSVLKLNELIELAREVGVDAKRFRTAMTDTSAELAFRSIDLAFCRENHVEVFPTYYLRYDNRVLRLSGFILYERFTATINDLTGGALKPAAPDRSDGAIEAFIREFDGVSPYELETAFDLTHAETAGILNESVANGKLRNAPDAPGAYYFNNN